MSRTQVAFVSNNNNNNNTQLSTTTIWGNCIFFVLKNGIDTRIWLKSYWPRD